MSRDAASGAASDAASGAPACRVQLGGSLYFALSETFLREILSTLFVTRDVRESAIEELLGTSGFAEQQSYEEFRQRVRRCLGDLWDEDVEELFDAVVAFKAVRGAVAILLYGAEFACGGTVPLEVAEMLSVPNVVNTSMIHLMLDLNQKVDSLEAFGSVCSNVYQGLKGDLCKTGKNGKSVIVVGPYLDPRLNYRKSVEGDKFPVVVLELLIRGPVPVESSSADWSWEGLREVSKLLDSFQESFPVVDLVDGDLDIDAFKDVHARLLKLIAKKGREILRREGSYLSPSP